MTAPPLPSPPSKKRMLARGFVRRCPVCGSGHLFTSPLNMVDDCPRCSLHFERIEGHWIGAIGMNTIVSFFSIAVTFTVMFLLTFPEFAVRTVTPPILAVAVLVPFFFFGPSRTLWTAIDIGMRPLEPHEVDWTKVDPGAKKTDAMANA